MNILRIYPVELAAELETGSRQSTGEYTPPDTTQLVISFQFFFSSKSVYSRRELFANSTHTADAEATTVESRRRCVSGSTRHTDKRRLSLASVDHGIYIFIFVIIHSKMFRCDWSKSCHVTCSALKFNLVIPWRRNNYVYGFKQYILPSHILPPVTPPIMAQLHPLLLACSCSVVA